MRKCTNICEDLEKILRNNFFKFQVSFNSQSPQSGFIKEWTLMLHGTRDPPYSGLPVSDPHSKLAIVKKAHEERNKM